MPELTPEELKKLIHHNLRELPLRRAPRSLEDRVMAAIAAQQARPWWQQAYGVWPQPAKVAFLILSAALAALVIYCGMEAINGFGRTAVARPLDESIGWLANLRASGSALVSLARHALSGVDARWLYLAGGVMAAAYASLLGVGAAAYRTLWSR